MTPMQKQERQPSLLSWLRWKVPGLQLEQDGSCTFICNVTNGILDTCFCPTSTEPPSSGHLASAPGAVSAALASSLVTVIAVAYSETGRTFFIFPNDLEPGSSS